MDAVRTADIVKRVRQGETEAYADLVCAYQPGVWRTAAAMLGNIAETENLVQQAFVDAFLKLDQFRPGEDFAHWIGAIARNLVRQELRRRGRETRRLDVYRQHLLARFDDDEPSRDHESGISKALAWCMASLGTAAGETVRLRYRENLPIDEVAKRTGRSIETCQRMLSRARMMLRKCIERRMAQA